MKLIRLQAFKGVFEEKTVTGAAHRLKCSQPRVSRLLQELEEEIGFPLFLREKQRLEPTVEGKRFYKGKRKGDKGTLGQMGTVMKICISFFCSLKMHKNMSP